MPKNVQRFAWLWIGTFLISFAEVILRSPKLELQVNDKGLLGAISLIIFLLSFWLTVWRGNKWARAMLFFLFVRSLVHEGPLLSSEQTSLAVIHAFTFLAEAAAFIFIFTGDAKPWFEKKASPSGPGPADNPAGSQIKSSI